MNAEDITLRSLCKTDYPYLEDIIRKTWKYDSLTSIPKDARHMARLYLRACLVRTTFSCVAVAKGKVIGVILASSKKSAPKFSLVRTFSQLSAVLLLFTTRTGRELGRFFNRFDEADTELLQNCGTAFDGEICFFAMSEAARGCGIGKRLFTSALDYLKAEGAKSIYLFTDSTCTYQFYEKRGMKRLGEKVLTFQPFTDYKLHMFIYGYELCHD